VNKISLEMWPLTERFESWKHYLFIWLITSSWTPCHAQISPADVASGKSYQPGRIQRHLCSSSYTVLQETSHQLDFYKYFEKNTNTTFEFFRSWNFLSLNKIWFCPRTSLLSCSRYKTLKYLKPRIMTFPFSCCKLTLWSVESTGCIRWIMAF